MDEPPAAAEPSDFFSVDADVLPLAAGELALPDVLALPDALPCAWVLGFCSWLIDGVWPACDSCFFSCATAPNDSIAAATATAMGLNFIESPFLDIPIGGLPRISSKRRAIEY
jgi:hypothetical protein